MSAIGGRGPTNLAGGVQRGAPQGNVHSIIAQTTASLRDIFGHGADVDRSRLASCLDQGIDQIRALEKRSSFQTKASDSTKKNIQTFIQTLYSEAGPDREKMADAMAFVQSKNQKYVAELVLRVEEEKTKTPDQLYEDTRKLLTTFIGTATGLQAEKGRIENQAAMLRKNDAKICDRTFEQQMKIAGYESLGENMQRRLDSLNDVQRPTRYVDKEGQDTRKGAFNAFAISAEIQLESSLDRRMSLSLGFATRVNDFSEKANKTIAGLREHVRYFQMSREMHQQLEPLYRQFNAMMRGL